MKVMYNLLIYVGIAIAKLDHFASPISSNGKMLIQPFQFTNDDDLTSKLATLALKDNSIIVLKSTAHYSDNLVRYLVACLFL